MPVLEPPCCPSSSRGTYRTAAPNNGNAIGCAGMLAANTPWASLYFVAAVIIGTFTIFNLFLAILLESFSIEGACNAPADACIMLLLDS